MINGLLILVGFQLAGEWLAGLFSIPVPGPVIGMLLLLCYLLTIKKAPASITQASSALLPYLPLFIIPTSVGIMQHWELLQLQWWALSLSIVGSLVIGFIITPWVMQFLSSNTSKASTAKKGSS
jgi:holin-like protein